MATDAPFAYPIFRSVWAANLASNLGVLIQSVGASWLMVESGASVQLVALIQTATSLPMVLFSLLAGAIADNRDRRKVMLTAQVFLLVASTILALMTFAGLVTPWLLIALTFLVGCGTALNGPAWQASVGDMVPREALPSAVAYNSMGMNIARSVGPALGGAIVAAGGAALAFLTNALSSLGLIVVLARWRRPVEPRPLPPERLADAMHAGLRYVLLSPQLRTVLVRASLCGITASAILALMPLIAHDLLGGGPLVFGMLFGCFGLGAVAGAMCSGRLRERLSPDALVQLCTMLIAIASFGTSIGRHPLITAPFLLLAGAGWVLAFSTINVSVQLASPRWVVARALSLYHMAVYTGVACGSWLIGLCAQQFGTAAALMVAGVFNLLAMVAARFAPLSPFNRQSLDPSNSWSVPETAISVSDRSGPVVVEVEHHISEADVPVFLSVMNERKRIRTRDGARNWTLMRDISDSELWLERYHLPTWLDYVRHNHRRTQADEANTKAIHDLQAPGKRVSARRLIEWQLTAIPQPEMPVDEGLPTLDRHFSEGQAVLKHNKT